MMELFSKLNLQFKSEVSMAQLTTTELPQYLQQLFTEVQNNKTPLTVFHNGEPLVVIYPASAQKLRPAFGVMKGSGEILGDIVTSALPETTWEALQ